MNVSSGDDESHASLAPVLDIVDAAVARVVRRHEATLDALRMSIRFVAPSGAEAADASSVTLLELRDREIASLKFELERVRGASTGHSNEYAREETARARQLLARAQATIRAQAREIERLASELAHRS